MIKNRINFRNAKIEKTPVISLKSLILENKIRNRDADFLLRDL